MIAFAGNLQTFYSYNYGEGFREIKHPKRNTDFREIIFLPLIASLDFVPVEDFDYYDIGFTRLGYIKVTPSLTRFKICGSSYFRVSDLNCFPLFDSYIYSVCDPDCMVWGYTYQQRVDFLKEGVGFALGLGWEVSDLLSYTLDIRPPINLQGD